MKLTTRKTYSRRAALAFDQALGEALRQTLRWRCPKCGHIAGYRVPRGIRCWWPDCRHESDGLDFEDVGP